MNVNGKKKVEVWGYNEFDKALKSCLGNRPLKKKRVQKYLRMMLGGTFDGLHADPFLFYVDKRGAEHLFEGIHRCMAGRIFSEMTSKPVTVLVERGLSPECVKHRGNGNQTIGDLLVKTRQQSSAFNHAAIAASIAHIFTGDNSVGSLDEYDAWMGICPRGVEFATSKLLGLKKFRLSPIVASFAVAYEVEPEAVVRVVSALVGESDLKVGTAARALDYRLDRRDNMNLMSDRAAMMRVVFAACFSEANGKRVERLQADAKYGQDYFVKAYSNSKKLQELLRVRSVLKSAPIELSLVPEGCPVAA